MSSMSAWNRTICKWQDLQLAGINWSFSLDLKRNKENYLFRKDVKGWRMYQRVNAFSESESNFYEAGGVGELFPGGRWRIEEKQKWDTSEFATEQTRQEVITVVV